MLILAGASVLLDMAEMLLIPTWDAAFVARVHIKVLWETALAILVLQDLALLVGSPMPQALRLVFAGATQ